MDGYFKGKTGEITHEKKDMAKTTEKSKENPNVLK